ncbi:unnamed protein product, partial [Mesorhabditis belari]|uniref:Uncharacterized protein n=1 Tax=Mesorhabditis belari TaxID=2138241 RepID=A0AAF3J9P4_9BILA
MHKSSYFLPLIAALMHQTAAVFECLGASTGPCILGSCLPLQPAGLMCTTGGCCDSTSVKENGNGVTEFKCTDTQTGGPFIPGVPCPSDTMKAIDEMGGVTCCPVGALYPINPQPCAGK